MKTMKTVTIDFNDITDMKQLSSVVCNRLGLGYDLGK